MDELDKAIIRVIQAELPIAQEPYKDLADQLHIEEAILLNRIESMLESGFIRRVGAVLNHRTVGFKANAMVVWSVPEDKVEITGNIMAMQREISHCYQRPCRPDWPYNMYTMIHGKTKEDCEAVVRKVAELIDVYEYEMLYSTIELKKTSFNYFE